MPTAFLFPGQGSQSQGMGADLFENSPAARTRFEEADDILGFAITEIMFGEGEDAAAELKQTEVTQPALYAHSLAAMAAVEVAGVPKPSLAAGHSLGEYSALAAAGALSFEDGLRAVRRRGALMADLGDERPGTMAAVLGLDAETLETLCIVASEDGSVVVPANYNDPGQIVISGDVDAVERASKAADESGAKRVIPLPVSGAFHSPLMEGAREGLAETLESLPIQAPAYPVVLNVTAEPTTDPDEIRRRLLEQLTSPVRWAQSMERMGQEGIDRFVEVGSGKVLSGLAKRTLGRRTETFTAGTTEEIQFLKSNDI